MTEFSLLDLSPDASLPTDLVPDVDAELAVPADASEDGAADESSPAGEASADEAPADETPADETPADEAPAESSGD